MKFTNFIYALLLLSSSSPLFAIAKRSHHSGQRVKLTNEATVADETILTSSTNRSTEDQVDPNDCVNVERWNKLNAASIEQMPIIKDYSSENEAKRWLKWFLHLSERYEQVNLHLEWNYQTNITDVNKKAMSAEGLITEPFARLTLPIAKKFNEHMKNSKNDDLKRIFGRLAHGTRSHNNEELEVRSKLQSEMQDIYSTARVCELHNDTQCYTLTPYLERLMEIENDYDRLTWAWKGWYDASGNQIRPLYLSFVDLMNKESRKNGYNDLSEIWIEDYEMGDPKQFEDILDQLLKDTRPLYEQLHAFVRGRLCKIYQNRFDCNGPIPAHLLGNMWAQEWNERADDFLPFPDTPFVNLTIILKQKHFSVHRMFTTAEEFFTSIGLYPMTPKFWARSMFTKPTDREVVCHGASSDMKYHNDFRIKMCTEVNHDHFAVVHHEMGHVEYFMAYAKHQPFVYRSGANSGFHEAIGDTIGMYVVSPAHQLALGLIDKKAITPSYEINFLMQLALKNLAFLPFAYAMDKYRFALFRDQIDRDHELNSFWWKLRLEHGGIMAPAPRNDEINFDPAALYHVPSNTPYFRYFISRILQFQFHRGMCRLKGHTTELHMCDIYGDKNVGKRFKKMLSMGNSRPWSEALEVLTGESTLQSGALLDFFEPLHKWLKKENIARGYPVGWM